MKLFRKDRKGRRLMLVTLVLLVTLLVGVSFVNVHAMARRIIIYFPQWGMYNAVHQTFNVGMIPWSKVTVINHAFMEVGADNKLASIDPYADFQAPFAHSVTGGLAGHFGEYAYYKTQYPDVKIMISVGGWTRGQYFHQMAATASTRATFIASLLSYFEQYQWIDGFDFDWEYPGVDRAPDPNDQYDKGCPGGPEDTQNFTYLLGEIRAAYNANGYANKLLTIAAPGGRDKIVLQQPAIYQDYLDFMNVMTYDFHGAWEKVTNHHSPIYANPNDPSPTSPVNIKDWYNTDYVMKYYQNTVGIHPSKLAVGAPYYSRGWQGVDPNTGTNGMFANATGAVVGNWDNPQAPGGQNSYIQMCTLENTSGYVKYRDTYTLTPWLYNKSLGITYTYEDTTSLSSRCDYIINNNYGGIIIWEISGDPSPSFPLTNLVYNKLSAGGVTPPPTSTITPGITPSPTRTVPSRTPTPTPVAAPWAIGVSYKVGDLVTYSGKAYKCISAHTAIAGWEPSSSPTLWSLYNGPVITASATPSAEVTPSAGITPSPTPYAAPWVTGKSYLVGDLVSFNGQSYKCALAHTSQAGWEPPNAPTLWQVYNGPVNTASPTATTTPTGSVPRTPTKTPTKTPSSTPTASVSPTVTKSATPTVSKTPTATKTSTPTASKTPTASASPTATKTPTATVSPTASGAQAWQPNTAYTVGTLVTYGGHTYKCIQAHTSLVGWEPPNVPALWQLVS